MIVIGFDRDRLTLIRDDQTLYFFFFSMGCFALIDLLCGFLSRIYLPTEKWREFFFFFLNPGAHSPKRRIIFMTGYVERDLKGADVMCGNSSL